MSLRSWLLKQLRQREKDTKFELLALSAVGFQMILIGILTAMLWLAGIAAIFISLGIFLFLAVSSLGIALLSREFPKAHFFYAAICLFSFVAIAIHIAYIAVNPGFT